MTINYTYYSDVNGGSIRTKVYKKGEIWHREDGPAFTIYLKDGSVLTTSYYIKGNHRLRVYA